MKERISDRYILGNRYKKEFLKQMRMVIMITLGFTIAFTWRQTIFDLSQEVVHFFAKTASNGTLSILTSIFITLICLALILITSNFLKGNQKD